MATAVEMEQFAEPRARLPPAAMAPARAVLGHQAGGLEGLLDEGVAEVDLVVAPGDLVKMPDLEALIPLPV